MEALQERAFILSDENLMLSFFDEQQQIQSIIAIPASDEMIGGLLRHHYSVINVKKLAAREQPFAYTVTIFTNSLNDQVAICNCPARKICKHIMRAGQLNFIQREIKKL